MALIQAIKAQGLTTAGGMVSTPGQNIQIHIAPTDDSERDIADRIIYNGIDGKVVRVRDVAEVRREYDTSDSYINSNGKRCVLLSLEMIKGNNIVRFGRDIDDILTQFKQDCLPDDVIMRRITDQPQVVGQSVSDFLRDLIISMLILLNG